MQKSLIVLTLSALLLSLSLGQPGSAQMGPMGAVTASFTVEQEIQALKALNASGLSVEQLNQLNSTLDSVASAEQGVAQRQEELKAFLLSWTGQPEAFQDALQPLEAQVQQARQALSQARQAGVAQLKGTLTIQQGEQLRGLMHQTMGMTPMIGQNSGMSMGSMMQNQSSAAQEGMMGGMSSSMGAGQQTPPAQNPNHAQHHPQQQAAPQRSSEGMTGMGGGMASMHASMMGSMGGSGMMAHDWNQFLSHHGDLLHWAVTQKLNAM